MQEEIEARKRNDALVDAMRAGGVLPSLEMERAFRTVLRHHFLPGRSLDEVYADEAIVTRTHPEYQGMAISSSSQPTAMALMLRQLQVEPGMKVLEIGAGTGYNAAVLAELTGCADQVWSLDVDNSICEEARQHLAAAGYPGVHVLHADGWQGYAAEAPYDRIILTASAYDIAPAWFAQLQEGGRLVLPWVVLGMQQRGLAFQKEEGRLRLVDHAFYGYMPLRGEYSRPLLADTEGHTWFSERLLPADVARLSRLQSGERWERPCALLPEPLEAPGEDNLRFFLAVQEPRMVARMKPTGENAIEIRYGLADTDRETLCFLERGTPTVLYGWGSQHIADVLEQHIARWFALGQPGPEHLRMVAYPPGANPSPQSGEYPAHRRWFTYFISWT